MIAHLFAGPDDPGPPVAERYVFDRSWFRLPAEVRAAWCGWARHHGIDPATVIVPGWLERRPDARQVAYLTFRPDEHGEPALTPDRQDIATETRVIQLEAVPSPFPDAAEWLAEHADLDPYQENRR